MENKRVISIGKQKVGDLLKRRYDDKSTISIWKSLITTEIGSVFKINLASVVCFLPVVVVLYFYLAAASTISSTLPFSSFLGIGYPTIIDVSAKAFDATQTIFMSNIVLLLPIAIFVSLFLSVSVQYVMRNLLWRLGNLKLKELFIAFKFNWLNGLIISFITALLSMLFAYMIYGLRNMIYVSGWGVSTIFALIGIIVYGVVFAIITMYAFSISITYKENIFVVYKDAIVLTFKVFLSNLVFFIITIIPIILTIALSQTSVVSFMVTIFIFIGFAYMLLTWTVFSQHIFDLATPFMNKAKMPYGDKSKNK